jgi:HpcH/HpaI aldolase/citrate lyase family
MGDVGAVAPKTIKSLLFAPGSDERKLLNALHGRADAIVADLENAVAPGKKAAARDTVCPRVLFESAPAQPSRPRDRRRLRCDIAFGLGSVWVVNYAAASVLRIDPATNAVLATISTETGTGSQPCGMEITPQYVWVAKHEPVGSIVKIDPSSNRIVDETRVGEPSPVDQHSRQSLDRQGRFTRRAKAPSSGDSQTSG